MQSPKQKLTSAFQRMHRHYGARGWWPAETPFEVIVGAILTQNTNWKNVERAIAHLKSEGLLTPKKLYALHPNRLSLLIRPAGYFRVKAKRLRHFLRFFWERYDGDVNRMKRVPTSRLREDLLSIHGIGPETADSILLYALGKPIFVIDAYTKRILERHSLCSKQDDYEKLQNLFMTNLKSDAEFFNEYHALLVEVGKEFCRAKPRCDACPLNGWNW